MLLRVLSILPRGNAEGIDGNSNSRSLGDGYGATSGGVDDFKEWGNDQWGNASARVNDDLSGMWTTTPEEWGDEYWEVLATVLLVAFGTLLCFLLVCCAPCCSSYDKPLYVATQAEMERRRNLKQPILKKSKQPNMTKEEPPQQKSQKRRRRTLWDETVLAWKDFLANGLNINTIDGDGSGYDAPRPSREASFRKKRRSSSRSKTASDPEQTHRGIV